jgi:protein tyrosine phosphatase (PTP) superfamily phosphohydrolase (DUF442 family)
LALLMTAKRGGSKLGDTSRPRRRAWVWAILAALACSAGLGWEFRRPLFHGNLGVVDPGQVIRSAQPTTELLRLIRQYHLGSILNLRGGSPADWWYEAEVKTATESSVTYYDLPLNATRRPSRRELLMLIDLLERCTYPLLIHCKSGADRTGLATAIYRMVRMGEPPDRAIQAFSLEFYHIPLGGPEHLHEPLDEYAAWLRGNNLNHTPDRFRAWVMNDYRSSDPSTDPPLLLPGPRARHSETAQRPAEVGRR